MRVSLPISTVGRDSVFLSTRPTACASRSTKSGVIGRLADRAANAVGAEILSCHAVVRCSCVCCSDSRHRAARRRAPPRCRAHHARARSAAPRSTASTAAATLGHHALAGRRDAGDRAQRGLARPAGQQRPARRRAVRAGAPAGEVLRHGLAEADARVEHDARRRDPAGPAQRLRLARGSRAPRAPRRPSIGAACIVCGSRCMCIRQMPQDGCAATASQRAQAGAAPRCR